MSDFVEDQGVLSVSDRAKVRASWELVEAIGREPVGIILFNKIFAASPETLQLFSFKDDPNYATSPQYKKHCKTVATSIASALEEMDDKAVLTRMFKRLGKVHTNLALTPAHYDLVGSCFIDTLG
jgi:hemoglobin-like flavoprotein